MNMRRTKERQRRVNFKRWFHIHIWSALVSLVLLLMLVVTGMLIYPLDQLGLRDIPLRSLWDICQPGWRTALARPDGAHPREFRAPSGALSTSPGAVSL